MFGGPRLCLSVKEEQDAGSGEGGGSEPSLKVHWQDGLCWMGHLAGIRGQDMAVLLGLGSFAKAPRLF